MSEKMNQRRDELAKKHKVDSEDMLAWTAEDDFKAGFDAAVAEMSADVETWKERSIINGKKAFEFEAALEAEKQRSARIGDKLKWMEIYKNQNKPHLAWTLLAEAIAEYRGKK